MMRARKWLLGWGVAVGLLALLVTGLVSLIPSDEELAQRASTRLQAALGVPVRIGALHWRLFPSPRVVIENAVTGQPQPIEVNKLTVYLNTAALWQRHLKVDRAALQGAVVPQLSLRGLGGQPPSAEAGQRASFTLDEMPVAHIDFQGLAWVSRHDVRTVYSGEADFDPRWRPRTAQIRRTDTPLATDLTLIRQGPEDRWEARINLGGGTANGEVQLQNTDQAPGELRLSGQLQPRGIEVVSALQAFNRRSLIAGKVSGDTTLSARGATGLALVQSLRTTTRFTLGQATLLRFDLDKAIRTAGKDHAGNTPLDLTTGQIDTQNTPQGMVIDYTRIKTRSGALSASGRARVANRHIEGEFAVDLVDGVVGVPLKVSGPLEQVELSVPAGAVAGAVAGTAVLPGIGTAIGARLGAALGKIFSAGPAGKTAPVPGP